MGMRLGSCTFVQIVMSLFRVRLNTYWVGVAKLSVERGFLLLRVYNWGWIIVRYGVAGSSGGIHYSGVSNVLKSMEKGLGLSEYIVCFHL